MGSPRRPLPCATGGRCYVGPDNGIFIFTPAAWLAASVPLERFCPAVGDPVRLRLPAARSEAGQVVGEVIGADRFGNLVTSVTADDLAGLAGPGVLVVEIAGRAVGAPVRAFVDAAPEQPAALIGSTGRLEIFVREASAQAVVGVGRGAVVWVSRR